MQTRRTISRAEQSRAEQSRAEQRLDSAPFAAPKRNTKIKAYSARVKNGWDTPFAVLGEFSEMAER